MKILLAADGSDYTRKMIDYMLGQRGLFDGAHQYTVFNAQLPLPAHAASAVGSKAVHEYHEEEANKAIKPALAALAAGGINADSAWKAGPLGETIAQYAKNNGYDLILMGSHGHGALGRLVLGSVANRVLAACEVPVLLVR